MSKRKSQTAVADYIAQGFLREALVNYLALLGWSPGTEEDVFTLDELVERFDLDAVQKGGAVFDRERLEWLNGQWIRRLDDEDLVERPAPFLEADGRPAGSTAPAPRRRSLALLPMVRERLPAWTPSGPGRLPVPRGLDVDPAALVPKRWDARPRPGPAWSPRAAHRRSRRGRLRGGRAGAALRRWPRRTAGRRATCSWRSAWP